MAVQALTARRVLEVSVAAPLYLALLDNALVALVVLLHKGIAADCPEFAADVACTCASRAPTNFRPTCGSRSRR